MEGYETFSKLKSRYNLTDYALASERKVHLLIERGEIEAKIENRITYISIQSVENYLRKIDNIFRNYIPIREFTFKLTGKYYHFRIFLIEKFVEQTCLKLLKLDIPIKNEKYYIEKNSYMQFLQDYISVSEAFSQFSYNSSIASFSATLPKYGVSIVKFQQLYEVQFIKRNDFENFKHKFENIISVGEVLKELGLSKENFQEAIKLCKIETFIGKSFKSFISKADFGFLKEFQKKTFDELKANTYTWEELVLLYKEIGLTKPDGSVMKKYVSPMTIHPIVRTEKYKLKKTLYYREGIDNYFVQLKIEKEISRLCETITDYTVLLQQILEVENISFSYNASITEKLWFQFINWKLRSMEGNRATSLKRVTRFRNATKLLVDVTKTKEIHKFSESELNLCIFNENVPKTYQKEIFSFIYNTKGSIEQKTGNRIYNLSKINYKENQMSKSSKEKEVYSIDEYLSLYNYLSDYEFHKQLAIDDVDISLKKRKEYKKYDSMWLYVLLHMNNGWRNGDILEFPRYDHPLFYRWDLDSIDSLKALQITMGEAEEIVRFYQLKWFEHNKTKEKATFYCSSVLTLPMAYAILICEFRCRKLHLHDEPNLIHFYNTRNYVYPNTHEAFFKNYNSEFKFESRKMNRTVLLYTSSVIESTLGGDPIQIAQHLRGHVSSETTNIYIQLPQNHLDFITEQLFDTGYFGYVYNQVNQLLIGAKPVNRVEQTTTSIEIRELLGDVVKLEDMSSYLKHLSQEREDLGEYLGEISKEELRNRVNLINLGLSPAKEQTYQCFFASCISKKIECNKCPFSIPHFYSLSVICKRIKRTLNSYKSIADKPDIPPGEKNKLYNLLLIDYTSIIEAKQKFGKEIIEMLIDNELSEFVEELEAQPDPEHQADLQFID